jgi:arsenate reductase
VFALDSSHGGTSVAAMSDEICTVLFNPRCSKCRQARDLLDERGVKADLVHYLDDRPSRDDIVRIYGLLGIDDPRGMMRTSENMYGELGLASAEPDQLFDAMASHPILIERPIVIVGNRAVVARPPERLLELIGDA